MTNRTTLYALLLLVACATACSGTAPEKATAGAGHDGGQTVAYLNDTPITMGELEQEAAIGLKKIEQERYDLFRETLDEMTTNRLIEQEASARGVTVEALKQTEIYDQVPRPTDAEVEAYYTENQSRSGGRTLEQLREPIRDMLSRTRLEEKEALFLSAIKDKGNVRILLEPPRSDVELTSADLAKGPEDAPITMIEYGDFQCPYCRRAHPVVHRLLAEYQDKIRFAFRDYPLENHQRAVPASVAARCAGDQDKYWDYYQHLMVMSGDLSDENLLQRAGEVGLNMDEFKLCYESQRYTTEVGQHFDLGRSLGVTATPTFFINGRMIVGAKSFEDFKGVVEEELDRLGETSVKVGQ